MATASSVALNSSVLLLNRQYVAIHVIDVKRAFVLLLRRLAEVIQIEDGQWANYDFVPGARTIYFTDFSDEQVGNFPKRLTFKTGQMELVELDGGQRALKASSASELVIPLPEELPSKFTVERRRVVSIEISGVTLMPSLSAGTMWRRPSLVATRKKAAPAASATSSFLPFRMMLSPSASSAFIG